MIVNSEKRSYGVVLCLPIPMEGKGGHSNLQFFGELLVPPHEARVVGTLICCSFLHHSGILNTIISIFGP